MDLASGEKAAAVVRPLARLWQSHRTGDRSRMTGDCHVRFYQRLGAKLPRPTNRTRRCGTVIPANLPGDSGNKCRSTGPWAPACLPQVSRLCDYVAGGGTARSTMCRQQWRNVLNLNAPQLPGHVRRRDEYGRATGSRVLEDRRPTCEECGDAFREIAAMSQSLLNLRFALQRIDQ